MPLPDPRFTHGLELFNKRDFFECHEVIEELWLETKPDPYSDLYKGVIQAASALHQWKRGYLGGAHRLFLSSVKYLEPYEPAALGLDVAKLLKDMRGCFEGLGRSGGNDTPAPPDDSMPILKYRSH